ncbi:Uncharacterised protein [Pseudomonas mucidolens]|nr:hypothetical protein [Pseudomonas mucidolens]SQH31408.1 Uncharacterised protein [Pseudomonas mucidolens]
MEMLAGDGSELCAVLINLGATILHKQRQALMDYLMTNSPNRYAMATKPGGALPSSLSNAPYSLEKRTSSPAKSHLEIEVFASSR